MGFFPNSLADYSPQQSSIYSRYFLLHEGNQDNNPNNNQPFQNGSEIEKEAYRQK